MIQNNPHTLQATSCIDERNSFKKYDVNTKRQVLNYQIVFLAFLLQFELPVSLIFVCSLTYL